MGFVLEKTAKMDQMTFISRGLWPPFNFFSLNGVYFLAKINLKVFINICAHLNLIIIIIIGGMVCPWMPKLLPPKLLSGPRSFFFLGFFFFFYQNFKISINICTHLKFKKNKQKQK